MADRKNKIYLGVYIRKGQSNLINRMKKEFGKDKTEYIIELLDRNLIKDFEKEEKLFKQKKEAGLIE